MFVTRS